MYKVYRTKTILNVHKHCDGGWFWDKYSAFPYIGCEHGCAYCYWRDEKYNPHKPSRDPEVLKFEDPFSEYIKVKENAPELLFNSLKNKPRDLIYLDDYQPVEAKYGYARKMLEVCSGLNFPVFINEKSPMLLRDLDVLKELSEKSHLNVGWSIITTKDDETRLTFEPKAPPVKARFEAMEKLAENGIMTGTVFMPILPFIYDNEENIKNVISQTKRSGGRYVLDGGLTLWGYSKVHYYKALEKHDPELIQRYENLYADEKSLAKHTAEVHRIVVKYCEKYGLKHYIPRPVNFFPSELRINKEISGKFYLKARELQLSAQSTYEEWAYRKAAWSLDDLRESVVEIYKTRGISGLMQIPGIGKSLAGQVEELLKDGKKSG